jgi:hypothetical protein
MLVNLRGSPDSGEGRGRGSSLPAFTRYHHGRMALPHRPYPQPVPTMRREVSMHSVPDSPAKSQATRGAKSTTRKLHLVDATYVPHQVPVSTAVWVRALEGRVRGRAHHVALYLSTRPRVRGGGVCRATTTTSTIAVATGLSELAVRRAVQRLRDGGWLQPEQPNPTPRDLRLTIAITVVHDILAHSGQRTWTRPLRQYGDQPQPVRNAQAPRRVAAPGSLTMDDLLLPASSGMSGLLMDR